MSGGSLAGRGVQGRMVHVYVWWVPSLFTRNDHQIVNQLYPSTNKMFNKNNNKLKKKTTKVFPCS